MGDNGEKFQDHRLDLIDKHIAELRVLMEKLSDRRKAEIAAVDARLRDVEGVTKQLRVWQGIAAAAVILAGAIITRGGL